VSETVAFQCPETFFEQYDRRDGDPSTTHYCPGCGHGLVHKYFAEAIDDMGIQDQVILVNPVGCAVFAYYYFDVGNIQVPHGRCPAVATAIKRARPDSLVVGYQGDGDLAAIGGNEIIQAANRGENVTIFFVNNAIYGMTGGQMAPTTMLDMRTTTTPQGRDSRNDGYPLRVCELLATLEAPYYLERVALGDSKHNAKARRAVRKALRYQMENRGFSLIEVLSPCPTGWKLAPPEAATWTLETMTRVFPLGVYRDGHELDLGHPRRRAEIEPEAIPDALGLDSAAASRELPDHGRPIDEARIKVSGFGGQGGLALGLVLAYAGMLARRRVSWIPSYGPEMRGGTANCNVTLSDEEIGTPVIDHPSVLIALNGPSLDRFGPDVRPGGTILYNSSLIQEPPSRTDVSVHAVPANEIAERVGHPRGANMVMLGAMLHTCPVVSHEAVLAALPEALGSDPRIVQLNEEAIRAGIDAVRETVAPPST
jgi:2-oxoisovalerate ferredoxin oxidoreductase beta subunit